VGAPDGTARDVIIYRIFILLMKVQAFKVHEVIKSGKYVGLANIFG
jgi:hypothetical protein